MYALRYTVLSDSPPPPKKIKQNKFATSLTRDINPRSSH